MSSIDQSLSLFIPCVFSSIGEGEMKRIFESLGLGIVDRVDFVAKVGKKGMYYNAVYIHFSIWFDNITVANFQEKVVNPNKEARLVYDDPWFWIVLENTSQKTKNGSVVAPEWVPTSFKQQVSNTEIDNPFRAVRSTCEDNDFLITRELYCDNDFNQEGMSFAEIVAKCGQTCEYNLEDCIRDSKYTRDLISKEIEMLRKENTEIRKENAELREENAELRNYTDDLLCQQQDARISDETIISELNSENVFIKHQLETRSNELASRSNELYFTRRDNTLLNSEVHNLKDELQASFAENNKIREDFDKLKCEYEKLNKKNESTV
jgi:hypothetical protein